MATYRPLPPILMDRSLSDADLQEQWAAGAREGFLRHALRLAEAVQRAAESPSPMAWDAVRQQYEAADSAFDFWQEAAGHAKAYRHREAPPHKPAGVVTTTGTRRLPPR